MSTGPSIRSKSNKIKSASTITSRRATAIVKTPRILLRSSCTKAQLTARRAIILTNHPTTNLLPTGVHPRVDSHKVPM